MVSSSDVYCRSLRIILSHNASHAALVVAMYSASADDTITVSCFFDDQDIYSLSS